MIAFLIFTSIRFNSLPGAFAFLGCQIPQFGQRAQPGKPREDVGARASHKEIEALGAQQNCALECAGAGHVLPSFAHRRELVERGEFVAGEIDERRPGSGGKPTASARG